MSLQNRTEALLDALRFLVTSDMPAQHKKILIEIVTQAMRDDEAAQRDSEAQQQTDTEWQPHELEVLQQLLQGGVAPSWQQADEMLMRLSARLGRKPAGVRSKAIELNFGAAIDYQLARKHRASKSDP